MSYIANKMIETRSPIQEYQDHINTNFNVEIFYWKYLKYPAKPM